MYENIENQNILGNDLVAEGLNDNSVKPVEESNISNDFDFDGLNRIQRTFFLGKRALEGSIITADVVPLIDHPIRYGAALATLAATHNPLLSASVLAGTTAIQGGLTTLAAADVYTSSKRTDKLIQKINNVMIKIPLVRALVHKKDEKVTLMKEGLTATYLGTAIQLKLKKDQIPDISKQELRRRGFIANAAVITPIVFAEGMLGSEGIVNFDNPKISVPALVALTGLAWVLGRYTKRDVRMMKKEEKNDQKEAI